MKKAAFIGVAMLVMAMTVTAVAAAATPKQTYNKLLITPFKPPSGYYSAKVGTQALDARDKRHHVVGSVMVTLSGDAAVFYVVFPTHSRAVAWMKDKPVKDDELKIVRETIMGKVPGYTLPSLWKNVTLEGENAFGKTVRNGVTLMSVVKGNVLIGAATISTENDESGDVPATIRILGSGMKHLAKITS